MIKLLTKEQADWLIERFGKTYWAQTQQGLLDQNTIKEIINQCTEKEFPEFLLDKGASAYSLAIRQEGGNGVYISISDPDWKKTQMPLGFDEFKQFTSGCIEIVKWLEEQECT